MPLVHSAHTLARVKNARLADGDEPEPLARIIGEEQVVAEADRLNASTDEEARDLIQLYDAVLAPLGVALKSPRDGAVRGSHVSFGHADGLRVDRALIEQMNVIPDFRAPDNIRFGATSLYTTFSELREGVVRMAKVIESRSYEQYGVEELAVT